MSGIDEVCERHRAELAAEAAAAVPALREELEQARQAAAHWRRRALSAEAALAEVKRAPALAPTAEPPPLRACKSVRLTNPGYRCDLPLGHDGMHSAIAGTIRWHNCGRCIDCRGDRPLGPMVLCPECGNKRCPKASHHGNDCTGSNEPGQEGSVYE
jgi:hypothetical protein